MQIRAPATIGTERWKWRQGAVFTGLLLCSALWPVQHAYAQTSPILHLPLECIPSKTCWISNHVDLDPGPGATDYACGTLSYNGHTGTDFAIRDLRVMAQGVRVLAAAPGTVAAVRDGEPDISIRERGIENLDGKDCGNGVRIRHENGWQTQYCHLRKDSIVVKPGETVAPGDAIGKVGLSGRTEYPHLHFTVRRGKRVVDPFRGESDQNACRPGAQPLWDAATLVSLIYAPGSIYNFGVAAAMPQARDARAGVLSSLRLSSSALVFAVWTEVFGVEAGDGLVVSVEGPDGSTIISHRWQIEKKQARIFRTLARKRAGASWPTGQYQVKISLARARGDAHDATSASFIAQVY